MTGATGANDQDRAPRSVLALLVLPVFVLVIDTTFMNVSITTLVNDLDTTVAGIQTAITVYTLVMAAFVVTGGKLSRIWGPRRAYMVGLAMYGLGALVTSASINLPMLIAGWSVLEGLGAALVLPAVNALIVANFAEGRVRTAAYGTVAAVAAAGAAVGPLIGGVFTTYLSWRLAFAGEVGVQPAVGRRRHRQTSPRRWGCGALGARPLADRVRPAAGRPVRLGDHSSPGDDRGCAGARRRRRLPAGDSRRCWWRRAGCVRTVGAAKRSAATRALDRPCCASHAGGDQRQRGGHRPVRCPSWRAVRAPALHAGPTRLLSVRDRPRCAPHVHRATYRVTGQHPPEPASRLASPSAQPAPSCWLSRSTARPAHWRSCPD